MDSLIADDGCPVEAYAAMSPQPELDQITQVREILTAHGFSTMRFAGIWCATADQA